MQTETERKVSGKGEGRQTVYIIIIIIKRNAAKYLETFLLPYFSRIQKLNSSCDLERTDF